MEISNRQNIKKINKKKVRDYLKKIFSCLSLGQKTASFVFCDNNFIISLNQKYFHKNNPTDVIAFPLADELEPDYLGEVVVSVEEAVDTAKQLKLNWQKELLLYLAHGVLHLIGFKDKSAGQRKKIEKKQNEIVSKFKNIKLSQ